MSNTRALCIFSSVLGNAAVTRSLIRALDRVPELDPTYVILNADDYLSYPAPWWARLTNPWHSEFIARRKTELVRKQPFDVLLVYTWENAVAFRDMANRMPAAAMMDCVPATMDRQLRLRGRNNWKRRVSHWVHHRAFRSAAAEFDQFLPKTSDCLKSLVEDYGVEPSRCAVTLAPQDLDWWNPRPRSFTAPWRILFAGNDFERKGGDFLLRLYSDYLAKACELTILSNDPDLASRQLPEGVRWVKGATREQLREAFWDSHLFLLPTRQDFAPQVVAEAAAAGLPSLATGVDGIPDLIRDGETGFILPREASAEQWAEKVHGLLADPEALQTMSSQARRFAEEHLSLERFDRLVSDVIARLRAAMEAG
ncbi:MAG TPA: glycosyltransferase family 4 protein [Bryobacteraceae bacterium]|nr:glycosyltransferase family 4 protein [Bryobacteraceae bacterium]